MASFGKGSGPGSGPQAPNPYMHLHRNPPPPPLQSSPRGFGTPESMYPPTLAFQSNYTVAGPSQSPAAVSRVFDARTVQRPSAATPFLPSQFRGAYVPDKSAPLDFSERVGPSQIQYTGENPIRNPRRRDARPPDVLFDDRVKYGSQSTRSPSLYSGNHHSGENVVPFIEHQRPPGALFNDRILPVSQNTRLPSLFPGKRPLAENIGPFVELQRNPGAVFNDRFQSVHQRARSPPQFPAENRTRDYLGPYAEPKSSALSLPTWGNQTRPAGNFSNSWVGQDQSPQNTRKHLSITRVEAEVPKKIRTPPILSANESAQGNHHGQHDSLRSSVSPPPGYRMRSSNISPSRGIDIPRTSTQFAKVIKNEDNAINSSSFPALKRTRSPPLLSADDDFHQRSYMQDERELSNHSNYKFLHSEKPLSSAQSLGEKDSATNPTNSTAPKRTRLPPLPTNDTAFLGISAPQDESEREMQAKAKRLARFKVELSQPVESTSVVKSQGQSLPGRQNIKGVHAADVEGDLDDSVLPDHEGPKSTTIITGSCPDMCPVSEREERERKGDLDRYERVHGDRNQTNKSLAVKKYNRTAEREANLIRPMPVLKKTIEYLLYLLDQPYDDKFLGLYNFLWDRMRAIRMDLRMQHLFNLDTITMLEQMIRLHIIAMHELCEYTKGEGFSEGFDAHLNIEQMNKTSVELFQLYDDHRKKGINVPTEKEFRGYYALLKLDKHPGYKVEPAELSLDLSKMTPEIRQTREILFARDVARACRTGNFIAFFRLARKASYPQACLMHAHFAKLRTLALASLHSGLQINQGIPVSLVAKWLAMEDEDIENLLEYHGFVIKEFDEPYMVKDGQFLNSETDYPLKCSELVHRKKSEMISEDVSSSPSKDLLFTEEVKENQFTSSVNDTEHVAFVGSVSERTAKPIDEEMNDNEAVPSPKSSTQVNPLMRTSSFGQHSKKSNLMAQASPLSWEFSTAVSSPKSPRAGDRSLGKSHFDRIFRNSLEKKTQVDVEAIPLQVTAETLVDQETFRSKSEDMNEDGNSVSETVFEDKIEDEDHMHLHEVEYDEIEPSYDKEVAEAKVRLIFRIWRRHSLRRRELREQRQLAAMAALNSLSLGPPIRQSIEQPSTSNKINIDHIATERHEKHEKSWSRLNVSEVVAGALSDRTLASKCFCWKMIYCSQNQDVSSAAISWLLSKLMPVDKDGDFGIITSSSDLSIWKKWVPGKIDGGGTCYLSIVKVAQFDNLSESVLGSSAILFLVSGSFSLETERFRLHNLISSLPSDSCLPLLIIIGSCEDNSYSSRIMVEQLGLDDIDTTLVSAYSIIFLKKSQKSEDFDGFFSDEELRKGLNWLASHSPLPPSVRLVKTWELIGIHLSSSLRVLDEMGPHNVDPNHCVSAFNEALNRAGGGVANAAIANRSLWPCPEINLIDESSAEYEMVNLHLPQIGWSSSDRIEKTVSALQETELPVFEDDLSWLYKGSTSRKGIENQRLHLENYLINYLAHSSKMMGLSLATNEARVMLQKSARLELHNSTYFIIPLWVPIFRRIFNWRLMSLLSGGISTVYVLEKELTMSDFSIDELGVENISPLYDLNSPSLDEMIENCTEIETFRPSLMMVYDDSEAVKTPSFGNSMMVLDDNEEVTTSFGNSTDDKFVDERSKETTCELVVASRSIKDDDKLSKLLEQCNILQEKIEKKLSVFF